MRVVLCAARLSIGLDFEDPSVEELCDPLLPFIRDDEDAADAEQEPRAEEKDAGVANLLEHHTGASATTKCEETKVDGHDLRVSKVDHCLVLRDERG